MGTGKGTRKKTEKVPKGISIVFSFIDLYVDKKAVVRVNNEILHGYKKEGTLTFATA